MKKTKCAPIFFIERESGRWGLRKVVYELYFINTFINYVHNDINYVHKHERNLSPRKVLEENRQHDGRYIRSCLKKHVFRATVDAFVAFPISPAGETTYQYELCTTVFSPCENCPEIRKLRGHKGTSIFLRHRVFPPTPNAPKNAHNKALPISVPIHVSTTNSRHYGCPPPVICLGVILTNRLRVYTHTTTNRYR